MNGREQPPQRPDNVFTDPLIIPKDVAPFDFLRQKIGEANEYADIFAIFASVFACVSDGTMTRADARSLRPSMDDAFLTITSRIAAETNSIDELQSQEEKARRFLGDVFSDKVHAIIQANIERLMGRQRQ